VLTVQDSRRSSVACTLIAAAFCALAAAPLAARLVALAPGDAAPPLQGVLFPSRQKFAADWSQAKVTLVNFWATWCEPCRVEMPQLQALHERLANRGLRIIGVFEAWEADAAKAYLAEAPFTYEILKGTTTVDRDWGPIGIMPTTFLVDANGKILRRYVGAAQEQTDGLIHDVEALLDGRPMGPLIVPDQEEIADKMQHFVPEDVRRRMEEAKEKLEPPAPNDPEKLEQP
jgi:thiol-disulfide isomerase/thioredoxin